MRKKSKKSTRKVKNDIIDKSQSNIGLVFTVISESLKLYFLNLDKFLKYMTFPIFGQIIGIILIFICSYFFSTNFEVIKFRYPVFQNVHFAFLILILITIPGFLIFTKAFYDYLIAIGAICHASLHLKDNKIEDIKFYNENITAHITLYLLLILITSIIIFASSALFIVALNEDSNILEHIAKSINTVKGRFFITFLLLFFMFVICYLLLPDMIHWGFIWLNWDTIFVNFIEIYIIKLPLVQINDLLNSLNSINIHIDSLMLSKYIFKAFVTFIVTGYTLPIRDIAMTLFFRRFTK